ncbi:MAG TPA: tripartite tricarboxylate transporter permease [Candidatus Avidesulfovibrio excrementigallinarum]|nr:tripartite tricarboxylate transporter permease [Candidatus Avidesulfovibrio excrementigallinarum]
MELLSIFHHVLAGALQALLPANLFIMFLGLVVGIVGGMLPGISTITAVALFVPFTFAMPTDMAFVGLGAVFCGAMYGGANAAILINTPGTAASIATSFDGYPMNRKGEAEQALYLSLLASAFGGLFGALMLLFFFEPLSALALEFGSEAFFWMGIFGLTTLASMFPGQIAKGLLGGAIGLALSTIGLDPSSAMPRFTFDSFDLIQGLDMVAVVIGLFSISQMLIMLESKEEFISSFEKKTGVFRVAMGHLGRNIKKLLVASGIGTFIGALPGAGGSVAAIVAYNEMKRWDKNPERYGTGVPEGVLVPESANNASVGGALVPLLSLGIPGSATAAVLAGGLMAQGITPGPQLMERAPEMAYVFIASLIMANFGMILVGFVTIKICTRVLTVPKLYIIPAVVAISLIGSYSLRSSMFDVLVMILAGGISYLLLKSKIMPAAIALGLVLGSIIEESLVITMMRARGKTSLADLLLFSPMSMAFIAAILLAIFIPVYVNRKKQKPISLTWSPSLNCLRRYDFWVIALITCGGAFFVKESLLLEGVSRIFPLAVYSAITVLGVFICARMFFEKVSGPMFAMPRRDRINVAVYTLIILAVYPLLSVLGFYTACFLGLIAMAAFGIFHVGGKPVTFKECRNILFYAVCVVLAQYAGFHLLLNVQTPTGMFI